MNAIGTIARKELRGLFQSPVALIFLGIFLVFTLFTFFSASAFFARNLADVRPLFEWLPLLLIGLVSAVTMRSWAEERKAGTLEVLLTLPVSTRDLVLGKFLAGLGLVATALALTAPLPLMVATLGELDWGPVIGGYVGALLLGGAYLAIGQAVSARTDNQIVALLLTLVIGGSLYAIGTDPVADLLGNRGVELVHALGTGARFESIERGVLDLRDLLYYASITAFFLVLNGAFLDRGRLDPDSATGGSRLRSLWATVALVAVNALLVNVWLAPVTLARVDLTAQGEYSLSPVTRQVLAGLDEPLVIQGFFSERTHPLLSPLVPAIRDLVLEYGIYGGDHVQVSFVDPATDEALEQEIGEQYAIRSVPFGVTDRHSQAVVNSYFHLLVKYGDEYEVLSFDELIEVSGDPIAGLDVRLRNLEYDLTRTIRRVSQDFESLESLLAKLPAEATFTLYATPAQLPAEFQSTAAVMREVSTKVAERSGGKVRFQEIDPSGDAALQQRLAEQYGVQPLAVDLFGDRVFYLHLLLDFGDTVERVLPRGDVQAADLQQAIEAAVKRSTPGQLKTVGLATEIPEAPNQDPRMPPQFQPPPPEPDYRGISQLLAGEVQVRPVQLEEGWVPDTIDVLVVGKLGALTETAAYALDQYLMRGGAVIALAGAYRVSAGQGGISAIPEDDSLFDLLSNYGVAIENALVMDPQNAPFPVPVVETRGGFRLQRIELLPYPMFPDIRSDGFNRKSPVLSGLSGVTVPWSSPVTIAETLPEGVKAEALLSTSAGTWLNTTGKIEPDFAAWPDAGFGPTGDTGRQVVAAALTGRFPSGFANKPTPGFARQDGGPGRALRASVADGRLVVIGSSEMVSDVALGLAQQPAGEVHRGNLQFLQNAIDWATEDTDLLAIRSSGAFARTLAPMDEAAASRIEWTTWLAVALPLLVVVIAPRVRRAGVKPIPVTGGAA